MKTTLFILAIASSQLHLGAAPAAPGDFVAHEWGTFTSVQGADGKLVPWHPLETSQLPSFVYDRTKPTGHERLRYTNGKDGYMALQRLETPVIYFYSDQARTLDVTVRFPKGLITEWYPYADKIGPSWVDQVPGHEKADDSAAPGWKGAALISPQGLKDSVIRWPEIRLKARNRLGEGDPMLPHEPTGNHYYAARATDANVLAVQTSAGSKAKTEQEKLLFYRGVGSFETPLKVTLNQAGASSLTLANQGSRDLGHLFVLEVQGDQARFTGGEKLAAGHQTTLQLAGRSGMHSLPGVVEQLGSEMRKALEQTGLYPREAAAMVQTWRDSWFEEQGVRVLYLLPGAWTDEVLPLQVEPKPREVVRVMVGRAEVITPQVESEVRNQVVRFEEANPKSRTAAIEAFQALRLGRFAEAAVRQVVGQNADRPFSEAAWQLLSESNRSGKSLARN